MSAKFSKVLAALLKRPALIAMAALVVVIVVIVVVLGSYELHIRWSSGEIEMRPASGLMNDRHRQQQLPAESSTAALPP